MMGVDHGSQCGRIGLLGGHMPDGVEDAYSRVLADAEASVAADAAAVAAARYAGVDLADRLRASVGMTVLVQVVGLEQFVAGTLTVVTDGALAVADRVRTEVWVVPFAAVAMISGLAAGHRGPVDRVERGRSMASLLRPAVGSEVVLAVPGSVLGGRLQRVGRDHLQLASGAAPAVVPFTALRWARVPAETPGAR
jgi:hypothetical protein